MICSSKKFYCDQCVGKMYDQSILSLMGFCAPPISGNEVGNHKNEKYKRMRRKRLNRNNDCEHFIPHWVHQEEYPEFFVSTSTDKKQEGVEK